MNELYPNVKQSFGLFGFYILASLVGGVAVIGLMTDAPKSLLTFVTTIIINGVVIAIALNYKQAGIGYLKGEKVKTAPMVVLVVLLLDIFLIIFLDPLVELIPMPDFFQKLFEDLVQKNVWAYLTIGVVAPVTEELLFRRIMLEGLEKNYGPRRAILWSAFLFALFHLNPWQGIAAFVLGLFLAWIYLNTRNIWLCVFFHFFNNSLAYGAFVLMDDPTASLSDITGYNYQLVIIMGLSLICLYFCYLFLDRQFKKSENGTA